jgi:hypothetical protein
MDRQRELLETYISGFSEDQMKLFCYLDVMELSDSYINVIRKIKTVSRLETHFCSIKKLVCLGITAEDGSIILKNMRDNLYWYLDCMGIFIPSDPNKYTKAIKIIGSVGKLETICRAELLIGLGISTKDSAIIINNVRTKDGYSENDLKMTCVYSQV